MLTWNPNWNDVQFDHAVAQQYAYRCRAVAFDVRNQAERHRCDVAQFTAEWNGFRRDDFDDLHHGFTHALHIYANELEALARRIESQSDRARFMQIERELGRRNWRAESEAEERARNNQLRTD
jgi:CBS-domain-containing membrane protein